MKNIPPEDFNWTKENEEPSEGFDFDAFLKDEPVWDPEEPLLQAGDIPDEEEIFAPFVSPAPSGEEASETGGAPPSDPELKAPPRPEIFVAPPERHRVLIQPERAYKPAEEEVQRSSGRRVVLPFVLCAVIVALIVFMAAGIADMLRPEDKEAPEETAPVEQLLPTMRPATAPPAATRAPEEEPEPEYFAIRVSYGSGGSVFPEGEVSVLRGDSRSFQIVPAQGYELTELVVDGEAAALTDSYTFSEVDRDHSIYAVFSPLVTPSPEPTPEPTPDPTPVPTPEPTPPPTEPPAPPTGPEPVIPEQAAPAPESAADIR